MAAHQRAESLASRLDKLNEFERQPISDDKLHTGRRFAALYAGEHVAATEFVIGAMFVKHGISASDLVLGLIVGNLLAIASWVFICAPIAVRVRLTLYWYVRRIIGPGLTVVYNIVNAMLFCCLAAAMIGVSASAVGLVFKALGLQFKHPELTDTYPNSIGWVVVVLVVGAVVVTLAILGFKKLTQFSAVCSPWMFLVFIAGAIATLPRLGEFSSLAELWNIAETQIWNGVPLEGVEKLGLWHVIFFAWFCNLAMHVGLSDMAIFRYARRWYYGFYSAFGMYLGHFLAWICAGVMGATVAGLNPGQMAHMAAGLAGAIAVVIAGWTTANPTIYRAGLALQIITPNWARWKVTLLAGLITTIIGCFPLIFMKLLDFVALYGLTLMPIGAVVVTEHWLFPKLGLKQSWADRKGVAFNIPALITWVTVLLIAFPTKAMSQGVIEFMPMDLLGVHLYFRWLPCWFIAVAIYIVLCCFWPGARMTSGDTPEEPIPAPRTAAIIDRPQTSRSPAFWIAGAVALLALVACLILPLVVFFGGSDKEIYKANLAWYKKWFLLATFIYFISAITWTSQRTPTDPQAD